MGYLKLQDIYQLRQRTASIVILWTALPYCSPFAMFPKSIMSSARLGLQSIGYSRGGALFKARSSRASRQIECHFSDATSTVTPPLRLARHGVLEADFSFDPFDQTSPEFQAFASQCATAFRSNGWVHIPGYLSSDETASLLHEAQSLLQQGRAFYSTDAHTVYQEDADPSLPADHPRNALQRSSKRIVDLAACGGGASLLARLYARRSLLELVRICAGLPVLFPSACPYNAAYYNAYAAGDGLGWHFDRSEFGVNLVLQSAGGGGEFQFHHRTRDSPRADVAAGTAGKGDGVGDVGGGGGGGEVEEYRRVGAILAGGRDGVVTAAGLGPGGLVVFAGRDSLHRVSPVTAAPPARVNAILTFEGRPGQRLSEYSLAKFFGRAADGRRLGP